MLNERPAILVVAAYYIVMAEVTISSATTISYLFRENQTATSTTVAPRPASNPSDPSSISTSRITLDDSTEWWSDSEDVPALRLDGSEGGLWSGAFVPPPPRPLFLDEGATPDGVTTCDLCTWAWQGQRSGYHVDKATEAPGELGWVLTLVIVSIISAAIGAVIMITALHCKSRMKNGGTSDSSQTSNGNQSTHQRIRPPISTPDESSVDKELTSDGYHMTTLNPNAREPNATSATGTVWSWLTHRRQGVPSPLTTATLPAENHYTHMDENYSSVGEALYAELDRDSNSPAYQNSAYTDPDAQTSSAPSSAYYSDLSVTTMPDRAYEVVNCWEGQSNSSDILRRPPRLAAISETANMPSDYV